MATHVSIPLAVVVAGALIAGAIVLTRQPPEPREATKSEPPMPATRSEPPTPPPAPSLTPEIKERGQENARQALETFRPKFLECWAASVARTPEPPRIQLVFSLSFAPDGSIVALGIAEDHAAERPDVAECMRALRVQFSIPAPGVVLVTEVPFTLP